MSVLKGYAEEMLPAAPPGLYRSMVHLDSIVDQLTVMFPQLAQGKVATPLEASNPSGLNLPPFCDFKVVGIDGKYIINVTLPQNKQPGSVIGLQALIASNQNSALAPIVHRLQSAIDLNFNANSNVTTYGPTAQVQIEVQDPNQTKFFRLSSSFDGVNFNPWRIFSSALVCGPVAVQSGFLRSTSGAPNSPTNTTNNATVDSIDAGSSATIRIYGPGGVGSSWSRFDGQGFNPTVPGGSVPGASYSTAYIVMWSQATGFQAFPKSSQYVNALPDSLYFAGIVTTVAAGGGGGSGGGGGPNPGGGGCPLKGAPVHLFGRPEWWTKHELPCEDFILIMTDTGRVGIFSRKDRRYSDQGLIPLDRWRPGFMALTDDGEEKVTLVKEIKLHGASVDSYEGRHGHVYSAWGFIGHNFKGFL